jgi:type IV pilus assembly protein PilQ
VITTGPSPLTVHRFTRKLTAMCRSRQRTGRVADSRGRVVTGLGLLLSVVLAGELASAAGSPAGGGTPVVQLRAITGRVNSKGASIVIEASEPAGYVTSQPDPLTVFIDLRNVISASVANRFAADAKSPITGVAVEASESLGTPLSRVRISLAQAVAHRVRADRNTIVVDFDNPAGNAPYVLPPASRGRPDAMAALERNESSRPDPIAALGVSPSARPPASARATDPIDLLRSPADALGAGGRPASPVTAAQAPAGGQAAVPVGGAAPALAGQVGAQPAERRFTGSPVSLDFQGADLRAVLRTFSEVSGLNMVIDPAVQGTVDVALRDVPWDQALDIILRANKLGYIVDGTIVRIAPLTALAEEEAQRRKLADEQALAGELRVVTRTLSYAKAEDLQGLLTKSALSPRGTVQVDPRTNTLIITDLSSRLQTASDLITTLDRAQPQVEIEARIVQTNKNYARALGIQWGFNGRVDPTLGNTTSLAFPNSGSLTGGVAAAPGVPAGTAVNLPAVGATTSAVGLALGSINGAFNLDVALSALESSGNARLLSTPRVSTQNNVQAEITQGVKLPYQTLANNTVTTAFTNAALSLMVTPQITSAGTVIMKILVDNGSVGPSFNGVPSIVTQAANTTVLVNDGQTTVIGGIYQSTERASSDRTPGLDRIPLLKWLFRRERLDNDNTELLIFITPRIIKG